MVPMAHFEWTAFAWIPARTMIIDYQGPATQGLAMRIAADIREAIVAGRLTVANVATLPVRRWATTCAT